MWVTFALIVVMLAWIAVRNGGWKWRTLGRFLLATLIFQVDPFLDALRSTAPLSAAASKLLSLLPLVLAPAVAAGWSWRELAAVSPALVALAAFAREPFLIVFGMFSFASQQVRAYARQAETLPLRSVALTGVFLAFILSLMDLGICWLGERTLPAVIWFSVGSVDPLERADVWLILAANLLAFGLAVVLFGLMNLIGLTRPRPGIVLWTMVGLVAAGLASRLDGRALQAYASIVLAGGLVATALRFTERAIADVPPWARPRRIAGICAGALVVLGALSASLPPTDPPLERPATAGQARQSSPPPRRPNVLLVVLDTVRAESLSLYGRERPTTPLLEARAKSGGVVYEMALAPSPWTLPTHVSLVTGLDAREHGVGIPSPMSGGLPSLPEELGRAGYATAAFIGNTEVLGRYSGFARGFEHFESRITSWKRVLATGLLAGSLVAEAVPAVRVTGADLRTRFFRWLPEGADRPFFALINFYDAHERYEVPDRAFDRFRSPTYADHWLQPRILPVSINDWGRQASPARVDAARDVYEGAIRYIDFQLEEIFRGLEERGKLDDTLVVITSDHGEQFGERGLFVHANSLYTQLLAVPLVVFPPRGKGNARRWPEPVGIVDVARTIVDIAGIAQTRVGGKSLAPTWCPDRSDPRQGDRSIFGHVDTMPQMPHWPNATTAIDSIVRDGFHYIRWSAIDKEELFDLRRDPAEAENLAGRSEQQPILDRLRELLRARTPLPTHSVTLDRRSRDSIPGNLCVCCDAGADLGGGCLCEALGWTRPGTPAIPVAPAD